MFEILAKKINLMRKNRVEKIGRKRAVIVREVPYECKIPCRKYDVMIRTISSYRVY